MDPIEEYLREATCLPSAGEGRFSLDPSKQRLWLSQVGLTEPEWGFLKLAQAAYLARSPYLEVEVKGPSTRWEFGLRSLPKPPCWDPGHNPWERCLSLALLALSQSYQVQWSWPSGQGQIEDGQFREQLGPMPLRTFRVEAQARRTSLWSRLAGPLSKVEGLRSRLRFYPRQLIWNGQPLETSVGNLSRRVEAFLHSQQGDLKLSEQSRAVQVQRPGWPGHRRGLAAMGHTSKSWSETVFVLNGVCLESEKNLLDRPGVLAIVSARGLQTDMSGLQLVHDDAFRTRLEEIRPQVHWVDLTSHSGH